MDWSEGCNEEAKVVRKLNEKLGTSHTQLSAFTPNERARIEKAIGQKFNWDETPIAGRDEELKNRDKTLGRSATSLKVAAVADAAAGTLAVGALTGVTQVGNVPILGKAAGAARPFGELLKDASANPSKWQTVKKAIDASANIRNKGGTSVQELLRNPKTGEEVVRHTLLKPDGTLFEAPHFRPFWK